MGLTSGIGRLGSIAGPAVTGTLVAHGLGHPWGFYFFALVAILAVVALLVVPGGHHAPATPTNDSRRSPIDDRQVESV
jgi:MFS family permease